MYQFIRNHFLLSFVACFKTFVSHIQILADVYNVKLLLFYLTTPKLVIILFLVHKLGPKDFS